MAYDEPTAARIRWMLAERVDVAELKMMGGLCFMAKGAMACVVSGKGGLLVRVPAASRDQALADPNVRPMEMGQRTMQGFVRVAPDGYRTDEALQHWVQLGIDAARALPPKRPRKRK